MNYSFEDVVNIYVSEMNKFRGITFTRRIKNYEKYEKDRDHFESLANKINNLNGLVDLRLLCRALTKSYNGYYQPSELCSLRAFRIYREYVAANNVNDTDESLYELKIKDSLKFLLDYMFRNSICSLEDYFNINRDTTPIFVKHIYSGSLDYSFVACFDDIIGIISMYPKDIVTEFLPNFQHKYITTRAKLLKNEKLKKFSENIKSIILDLLEKKVEKGVETLENNNPTVTTL